ncbi:MAG: replication-associated recombination protein A [bacterium]
MQTLFNNNEEDMQEFRPLAERMRPETFKEFFGQEELAGQEGIIRKFLSEDKIPSMILWGPPGSGKTTLANIIAKSTKSFFLPLSAVSSNIPEIKIKIAEAADRIKIYSQKTVMFIDEIHRFNKLQQDAFLPHIERGTIILIGATTENPSFEVNSAILSRCKVLVLQRLSEQELCSIIKKALSDNEKGIGKLNIQLSEDGFTYLASHADGDARRALNLLEEAAIIFKKGKEDCIITAKSLAYISQRSSLLYDKKGEEHYNLISALHKSMRDSDADAALYWLGRMLEAGEDPLYIARRLIRFASEDIGNADTNAIVIAIAAKDAFHFMGRGEGDLALAQAVVYLSRAKKDNSLYEGYEKVKADIKNYGSLPVPFHLRNAPTKLMKDLNYGKGYKYAHNFPDAKVEQIYFPEKMGRRKYFD